MAERDPREEEPRTRRAAWAGWALIALGLAGILWGVLYLSSRAYGEARPGRTFAERRSYDQVKSAAHEAFPGFLLRAGTGFVLLLAGAWSRQKSGGA